MFFFFFCQRQWFNLNLSPKLGTLWHFVFVNIKHFRSFKPLWRTISCSRILRLAWICVVPPVVFGYCLFSDDNICLRGRLSGDFRVRAILYDLPNRLPKIHCHMPPAHWRAAGWLAERLDKRVSPTTRFNPLDALRPPPKYKTTSNLTNESHLRVDSFCSIERYRSIAWFW